MRQHSPLAASTDQIEDCVDELASLEFSGAATGFRGRDESLDLSPLSVGQIFRSVAKNTGFPKSFLLFLSSASRAGCAKSAFTLQTPHVFGQS